MKIKVCGMREAGNLAAIAGLDPDLLGFVFYDKSKRFMRQTLAPEQVRSLPAHISKVGVFVDASIADLQAMACQYQLDYVQLHGHESPAYCQQAQALGLKVIKAFAVDGSFDFDQLTAYSAYCDFFLFDTKGELPGGNGLPFDWSVLARYEGPRHFFLSGGLGLANADELQRFHHPLLCGLDFNSRLETAPGVKDVAATRQLLERLRATPADC